MPLRIAIAGFQHETNTFAATPADLYRFARADAWPALTEGDAIPDTVAGINIPTAGFIHSASEYDFEVLPLLWCAASPSAPVTEHAFETIAGRILSGLRQCLPVDGVFLELHGAMICEHLDDGEGELLRRLREVVGSIMPVVVSVDFHANISPAMVEYASLLVGYRSYPHLDMADTGRRAATLLANILSHGPLEKRYWQTPYLIPLPDQCTLVDPMATLMAQAQQWEQHGVSSMTLAAGFPPGDTPHCGPSLLAYGRDGALLDKAIAEVSQAILDQESAFGGELLDPDTAVQRAMDLRPGPVVLADTQDNPGGGGEGDTVGLLRALIQHDANALLVVLTDPAAAAAAHEAGVGAVLDIGLGASGGHGGEIPIQGHYTVEALGNGRFTGTGPFYQGAHFELGPMALLRTGWVHIAITSYKQQAADQAIIHHLGKRAEEFAILALKSSVHFRADFDAVASHTLVVESPGPNIADPAKLPYHKLRAGVRLGPGGKPFEPPTHF